MRWSQAWSEARSLTVLCVFVIAALSVAWPLMPIGASLWLALSVLSVAWPRPNRHVVFDPEKGAFGRAVTMRLIGRAMTCARIEKGKRARACPGLWRLGPGGECKTQQRAETCLGFLKKVLKRLAAAVSRFKRLCAAVAHPRKTLKQVKETRAETRKKKAAAGSNSGKRKRQTAKFARRAKTVAGRIRRTVVKSIRSAVGRRGWPYERPPRRRRDQLRRAAQRRVESSARRRPPTAPSLSRHPGERPSGPGQQVEPTTLRKRLSQKALAVGRRLLRVGPKPKTVTYESLAGICAAAFMAGADISVSAALRIFWPDGLSWRYAPDSLLLLDPSLRGTLSTALWSAASGWMIVHALAWRGRVIPEMPGDENGVIAPSGVVQTPMLPFLATILTRWQVLAALLAAAGAMFAGRWYLPSNARPLLVGGPGMPPGTGTLAAVLLLGGGALLLGGWRAVSGSLHATPGLDDQPKRPVREWESKAQRAAWEHHRDRTLHWTQQWCAMPGAPQDKAPIFQQDLLVPEDNPTHLMTLFCWQPGRTFDDYANSAAGMRPGAGSNLVLIEPYQKRDERGASTGHKDWFGFTLTHNVVDLGADPHLMSGPPDARPPDSSFCDCGRKMTDGKCAVHGPPPPETWDTATMRFVVVQALATAFQALKLGAPLVMGVRLLTRPGTPPIYESTWQIDEESSKTFTQFAAKTTEIAEKLRCPWVRVHQNAGDTRMTVLYGCPPQEAKLHTAVSKNLRADTTRKMIERAEWSYYMRASKLTGTNSDTPALLESRVNDQDLTEYTFRLPPGIDAANVEAGVSRLAAVSGLPYLASAPSGNPSCALLIGGDSDPLNRTYAFNDYKDILLQKPVYGDPRIEWFCGIGADGAPIEIRWEGEAPHMLIAGATGSGKSVLVNVMLTQMIHNNTPEDVQFWMMEPKIELQMYEHYEHVKVFSDTMTQEGSVYQAAEAILRTAAEEMDRRYAAYNSVYPIPKSLREARRLAMEDPSKYGHLNFPFLFIIMEECADYCGKVKVTEHKKVQAVMMGWLEYLARKARAAGMHMCLATQYPTGDNISSTYKQQSRALGLRTDDHVASNIIIGVSGLEKVRVPGRGMVKDEQGLHQFRSFFLTNDDLMAHLSNTPRTMHWPKLVQGLQPGKHVRCLDTDGNLVHRDVIMHDYARAMRQHKQDGADDSIRGKATLVPVERPLVKQQPAKPRR